MNKIVPASEDELSLKQKYALYEAAVQSPEGEVEILKEKFKELRGRDAKILREDFCGSSALSFAWVKAHKKNKAFGVDLDPNPLAYAREVHMEKLSKEQRTRIHLYEGNVLDFKTPAADIVVALNFSYYIFKQRALLKNYFRSALKHLKKDGIFFIDLFGGFDAQHVVQEKIDRGRFYYYWDCLSFNPIDHHATFAIHLQPKNKKKIRNVFVYDWRWWSLPELKDILEEVGFKKVVTLWEGDDKKGGGNGEFSATENEENCESWVAYIAALK